ncbi:HNH endonuclease [Streptomyces microflavus]|uniref:HNH endonuclease n=1 Tax=Streptomyces microflavus TaxID=1919 RepID=UPI003B227736
MPFIWKWSEPQPCAVCGSEERLAGLRRFCSWACRALHCKYDGSVPASVGCVLCGTTIDLTVRGKGGQRKKSSTKLCKPCRQDYSKYKMTARQLALRDGAVCGICRTDVDMDLRRSDDAKWCASVDHIVPRALGGTHEPSNLQLAHLYCNQVKSDLRGAMA